MIKNRHIALILLLLASTSLTGFTSQAKAETTPAEQTEAVSTNDPLESINRVVFDTNDFLDRLLLRPLAELYRAEIPPPLRDRIAGIVKNMDEPVIFANNLMQGDFNTAGKTFERFVVNTTLGGGGMFEVANDFDLPKQDGDFGQTLYTWGVGSGPYLVLPLFGPSNPRDAVGLGIDSLMSPWSYIAGIGGSSPRDKLVISDAAASGLTKREENIEAIDALREGSLDFYAQMRSVSAQHRAKELGAPSPEGTPDFEDYNDSPKTTVGP